MLRKTVFVLVVVACLCALPAVAAAKTVKVTASSNGKTVHLQSGDMLQITLKEVSDAGFRWRTLVKPKSTVLRLISTGYHAPHLAPGAVGGEGTRVNRYQAAGSGSTKVRLGYYGPSRGAKPASHFTLTVVVG